MTHAEAYRRIFDSRGAEEMRTLARIKRFMECVMGDDEFRRDLAANLDDPREVTRARGIDIDPRAMRPLFQHGMTHLRFARGEKAYPLAMMWDRYIKEMLDHRDSLRDHGSPATTNPRFHAWRERQIRRVSSECGASGGSITHPIAAFELSDGCSVGCWFCGISAERYKGSLAYTDESRALWRGVLKTMVRQFGDAAQSGFCYWGTDPMDNPDYPRFIEDYYDITGYLPQTTTAAPLKNVALTREVMDVFWKYRSITNRFSILSKKLMRRVHEEFTPDELMPVELVLQNKEALITKAKAGRARERVERLRKAGKDERISLRNSEHTTIACVSGFLVNMVLGRVQLVTPTRPNDRWPKGYKVLGERSFETGEDFDRAITDLQEHEVQNELDGRQPAVLRSDLRYEPSVDGFELVSSTTRHTCEGFPFAVELGRLVSTGEETYGSVLRHLVSRGEDVLVVNQVLDDLYQNGVFEERPAAELRAG